MIPRAVSGPAGRRSSRGQLELFAPCEACCLDGAASAERLCRFVGVRCRGWDITKTAGNIGIDQPVEFFSDVLALERHCLYAVDEYWCDRRFTRTGQTDADIRMLAFAGPVHHAAHHSHAHFFDTGVLGAPDRHLA